MTELPHVVFLPGLLDDQAMWVHQAQGVSGIASPAILDLVDHDDVSKSADWVLASAPETFALAGFSMGGYVAFEILRKAPHRVNKLALISTSARADAPERLSDRKKMIARAVSGQYEEMVDELIPHVIHPDKVNDRDLVESIREMALRIGADAFIRQLKVIMSRPDSRADLAKIDCPTIIVCGRDDVVTPPDLSRELADGIKRSELFLIEDCNHYTPMEKPNIVTRILWRWVSGSKAALEDEWYTRSRCRCHRCRCRNRWTDNCVAVGECVAFCRGAGGE